MKEIILFISGAVTALLVPADVSTNLRSAAVSLLTRVSHSGQAETAAPPESSETLLPAGEAVSPATAPGAAPAAAAEGDKPEADTAARKNAARDPDYISAEQAAEILRAFNGGATDTD